MGCAASKKAVSVTPALDSSGILRDHRRSDVVLENSLRSRSKEEEEEEERKPKESVESGKASVNSTSSVSFRLGNLHKYIEGEQVAAGWPAWLSTVAREAIHGWLPLKADNFEKLDKVGQGTYSTVFKARNLETEKIVALKKVRLDNFDPESVRFMAREIQILRRLDHPNVMKLEGLITSRLSFSIYLVFEYMEHDLVGLSSSPDIKFTEPQVKCYMQQLLSGLEHCHSKGIMHRDIKGANLLVNNEGLLKIADFGLANYTHPGHKQPLTSRVVTLWYRPPELLLGSTDYGASIDLWSVGCVFAEMFVKKPILQGRTEVEQLHKIFKLCGSPTDEYWKKSKLPHATIFKPHSPYESRIQETFRSLPQSALKLLEILLSVEPHRRSTAASALASEYFRAKPYACEPSSLPKYSPTKEIDAKSREDALRRRIQRATGGARVAEAARRQTRIKRDPRESSGLSIWPTHQQEPQTNNHGTDSAGENMVCPRVNGESRLFVDLQPMAALNRPNRGRRSKHISQGDIPFSGPLHVNPSSGFAWVKKPQECHPSVKSHCKSSSRSITLGAPNLQTAVRARITSEFVGQPNRHVSHVALDHPKFTEQHNTVKQSLLKNWAQLEHPDSFDSTVSFHSQDFSKSVCRREAMPSKHSNLGYHDGDRVEFSGPLLAKSKNVEKLLEKHERRIRQAVQRSWFQREKFSGLDGDSCGGSGLRCRRTVKCFPRPNTYKDVAEVRMVCCSIKTTT
ncbi:putative serine/threonine-protein kinase [Apostasia shenzhenica]|uniref:[RNA-polymerase]-subunit kinase n=1 Tax=Apostasia shenzhenica TaxID=1088818 RepID=A0A2I0A2K8_9ASPA|nr:putative serine/threonine-protein kinase [Apostasia shenzhenica]